MANRKYYDEKVFTLRISNKVFELVKEAAEKEKRSISKEIEYILDSVLGIEGAEKSKK